jgi:hypothetical protein
MWKTPSLTIAEGASSLQPWKGIMVHHWLSRVVPSPLAAALVAAGVVAWGAYWTAKRPQVRILYSLSASEAVQARGRAPRETATSQGRAQGDIKGEALGWFAVVALAQGGPVAAMFRDDLKRLQNFAPGFQPVELPAASTGGAPLQIYLSAGDLERAFDTPAYRPDSAIIPTNTGLDLTAASPATQRVLVDRIARHPDLMADLQRQVEARRKSSPASAGGADVLQIGVDAFVADLARGANQAGAPAVPMRVCLLATSFATGRAIDRRELFTQDRVRKGIAACLAALDAAGARSIVMPLVGAASSGTQADPVYEGQRLLKECRLVNAVAGIALGIHDFLPARKSLQELGIVQWDQEISGMFDAAGSRFAAAAYRTYAEQVKLALRKGLSGDRTTPGDVDGNCASTLNAQ